jgi:hypothetical protein
MLVLELLRARRGLLVLDNLETVLEPGAPEARYRPGYAGYGEVVQRLGASDHQGCLLLTSREQPMRADDATVRALRLEGLSVDESRALLGSRDLTGDAAAWRTLVERYAGNPLVLKVVGETIGVVFDRDIAAFLAQDVAVFGGIRQLLDEQVARLSALERAIVTWLAVEREPVGFAELVAALGPAVARSAVVEAVEALARRSLLERGARGTFTLQPVVLEYATERLVAEVGREVMAGQPAQLVSHALLQAQAKDYVRRSQERLIAQPLLEQLRATGGSAAAVERWLVELLAAWRGRPAEEQGYGPGNVVNLLRLLRGELRGLDLSRLAIRQAYLAEVEAQDASLAGAHLAEAALAEAFGYPTSVALSADGAYLAAGTSMGEVYLWRVVDHTLLQSVQGHSGPIQGMALSGNGRLVASGSFDGSVRLSETSSGRLRVTLHGHTGGVVGVALSRDGQLVAGASQDGMVRLWEVGSGRLLTTLQGHTGGVWGVALSGDGRLLATLHGHTSAVGTVALSGDGQLVASGSFDGTVKLWEAPSGQLLATLHGRSLVYGVALSGDGRLVASGSFDGSVRLWEASSGACLGTLRGDRRYERMDITGLTGVTKAQRTALVALGAVQRRI